MNACGSACYFARPCILDFRGFPHYCLDRGVHCRVLLQCTLMGLCGTEVLAVLISPGSIPRSLGRKLAESQQLGVRCNTP
jgi:hypothetical protein